MRPVLSAALLLAAALAAIAPALAQNAPQGRPGTPQPRSGESPATPAEADPVLAEVEGEPVRLSDLLAAAADILPAELRAVPGDLLLGMLPPPVLNQLLDRAINDRALLVVARRRGIDREPEVRARIERAERQEVTQALLRREVLPRLTEEALRARYQRDIASRPAEEEVRARHILVPTEAEARQVIAELARGVPFDEVGRRAAVGAGTREAGDLGWFKRGDMVPEFSAAAFAMRAGETSSQPVRTQFGWHVIRVDERRSLPPPSFEEAREELRDALLQEELAAALQRIRAELRIERRELPAPRAGLLHGAEPPAPPGRR
ncbi:MAG: peptidylprolyl isomerase [Rhodovarius sp.]|nr:peptidylprolyl isomerase [Rhodovarius sp.]